MRPTSPGWTPIPATTDAPSVPSRRCSTTTAIGSVSGPVTAAGAPANAPDAGGATNPRASAVS